MNSIEGYHKHFLKQHTGKDYDVFGFDDSYFETLLAHMGCTLKEIDIHAFELAHFEVLSVFLQAEHSPSSHMTIEEENKALTKLQAQVKALATSLADLPLKGQIAARLSHEIQLNPNPVFTRDGSQLSDFVTNDSLRPFSGITDLLFDLRVALERSKITRPTRAKKRRTIPPEEWHETILNQTFLNHVEDGNDEPVNARASRLRREHALPANAALLAFAAEFEEMWHRFSPLQFTEGRYEPDAGQYISRTLDAAEHCLNAFGAKYSQSLISGKIREVREARYEVS